MLQNDKIFYFMIFNIKINKEIPLWWSFVSYIEGSIEMELVNCLE